MKKYILNTIKNFGPKVHSKIVIFESDDWGSFRIPNNTAYQALEAKGVQLKFPGSDQYNLYDNLESTHDLELLFELLTSHKDHLNNPVTFTPLSLVANPDFKKIKESGYQHYFSLNLKESFDHYNKGNVLDLYFKGISEGIFLPQFHGREHLNVAVWMRALQNNIGDSRIAFEQEVWGQINTHPNHIFYQAAFDLEYPGDITSQKEIIQNGLELFKSTFGYKAEYFVPPNGPMNNQLLPILAHCGIKLISSDTIQLEVLGNGKTSKHFRYMGMKNKFGQRFIKRNCFFEPSGRDKDWVDSCLRDIELAFRYGKPAVISTHRVNYVGDRNADNRDFGLKQLDKLIKLMLLKWPDIEFTNTPKLFDYFDKN